MKKFLFSALILGTMLSLAACSSGQSNTEGSGGKESRSSQQESSESSSSNLTSSTSDTSASKSDESKSTVGMNLNQIAAGDYTSIAGTWKNEKGETITFNGNEVSGNGVDNVTLSLNDPSFEDKILFINATYDSKTDSRPYSTGIYFATAGLSPEIKGTDKSDTTKDRLILLRDGGTSVFGEDSGIKYFYYRVTEAK
ncbi:DUF6287 domain-containing protein [Lactococcus fujiensis]|nr:DUF6287 domain-containing protein [Lactococcus fujiensis]